jgi:hypothetical protein
MAGKPWIWEDPGIAGFLIKQRLSKTKLPAQLAIRTGIASGTQPSSPTRSRHSHSQCEHAFKKLG